MISISNFTGEGLCGNHDLSLAVASRGQSSGIDNCRWITQYSGTTFHLVPGMDPFCRHTVPGQKV
jgi:hypothetical protein